MLKLVRIVLIALFLFYPMLFLGQVSAVNVLNGVCSSVASRGSSAVCQDTNNGNTSTNPILSTLKLAIDIFSTVIGVIAVFSIVISGLRMIMSGGDTNTVKSSRNAIIYSAIGLFVVAVAQIIALTVLSKVNL